jgi:signal transduction histidine kinase
MRLSLAAKISTALVGLLLLSLLSNLIAIASAFRFGNFQTVLVDENLASMRAAEELEIALLEQRGYVASYILDDGNERWLRTLSERMPVFDDWLRTAREAARTDEERTILHRLEEVQTNYRQKRQEVVQLYQAGRKTEARQVLLGDVASSYEKSYRLCEDFIAANQRLVNQTTLRVRREVEGVTAWMTGTLIATVGLGAALLWLFFQGVLFPLRRMTTDARLAAGRANSGLEGGSAGDDLRELGHFVQLLMADVAEKQSDLQQSQHRLAQAEKLAAVGKLAASVAHEIRNPLTSVKMWLYSLRRNLADESRSRQTVDLIASEIIRLDNIVRQFLEFSRPPDLKIAWHDIWQIVDTTVELLKYRLDDLGIRVCRATRSPLPEVLADGEQLKQVLINLINNAADAMPRGGTLRLAVQSKPRAGRGMLVVHLEDTGSGMPQDVQERIFEPFFSTKSEGTGLGLCIAAGVMARQGGALELESTSPQGTRWAIWIPTVENGLHHGQDSGDRR